MTLRIRLVFAKGSSVVKVPSVSVERLGPVLVAAMTACAPGDDGLHTVPVKEIPSAALGAPLKHFLAKGKLPPSASPLLLSASYKAAERLDIAEMVRAVERAAMDAIASGDVRIEELSSSFAGCPRIAGLCDNYLIMPGARPPPPFNIMKQLPALLEDQGVVFLLCAHDIPHRSVLDTIKVVADTRRCRELAHGSPICREIVQLLAIHATTGSESRSYGHLTIFSLPEGIERHDVVFPSLPHTWLPCEASPMNGDHAVLQEELARRGLLNRVTLAVDAKGHKIYATSSSADKAYALGIHEAFAYRPSLW